MQHLALALKSEDLFAALPVLLTSLGDGSSDRLLVSFVMGMKHIPSHFPHDQTWNFLFLSDFEIELSIR